MSLSKFIDNGIEERKEFLTRELNKLGFYRTRDGRRLEKLSLYTLEWMYVDEKNKAARAYGDCP